MRPSRLVIGFGVVLILLLLISAISIIVQRRAADLDGSRRETANLAFALGEETSRSFESVDLVVRGLVEQIRAAGVTTPDEYMARMHSPAVHQMLLDRLAGLPQLDAITLIRADGTLINFSRAWPIPPINLSDRDYFRALRDDPARGPYISEPVKNRGTGTWTIYLVRRISAPDGTFVGLVLGAMELGYFDRLYSHLALEPDSAIALFRRDGTLLLRYPAVEGAVGHSIGRTPIFGALQNGHAITEEVLSSVDGLERIVSAQSLADFPLAVTIAQSKERVLAVWRSQALYIAGGALLAAIGLGAFVAILVRELARRERSEAALAISEKRNLEKSTVLEATLEHMSQGIMMISGDRRVPVYNRRAAELLGLPPDMMKANVSFDEILDYQWRSGEFGKEGTALDDNTRGFVGEGGVLEVRHAYERERPDGTILDIRSIPLPDGGVVRTYTDITRFKRAEAELRRARDEADAAARAKSDFLAMMSHEIRSPMNGVMGFVELLSETTLDEDQRQMVGVIQNSANSLLGLINDVLDFSRLEAGAVVISPEAVVLGTFLPPRLEPLTLAARQKGLALTCEIAPDVPECILADPLRLWQILLNLLGNAIKFTEKGAVRIEVEAPRSGAGLPRQLRFRVEDTGIGMDEAALARLFQPFMQADASTTKRFGGTGLGLSIARRLAALMGGHLEVHSAQGKGSRFELIVPLVEAKPLSLAAGVTADRPSDFRSAGPFRILIAEDQATNRFLIQRQLTRLGIEVDLAEDGLTALMEYQKRSYALLVTDCHMPEMDGIELTALIRAGEGNGVRMPIIGLTADITPEIARRCREAGMDEVLIKPTRMSRLEQVLRAYLLAAPADSPMQPVSAPPRAAVDFDPTCFNELFADALQDGFDWLEQYLAAADELIAGIDASLTAPDAGALAAAAHRLAGVSLSVGAERLGQLARRIEQYAKPAQLDDAAALLPDIKIAAAQAAAAIRSFRSLYGTVEPAP